MLELLSRFRPDPDKIGFAVVFCLVVIWLIVAGCSIASVRSQKFSRLRQLGWILGIVCLPIIGLMLYLPFSFRKEGDPLLLSIFPDRSSNKPASSV